MNQYVFLYLCERLIECVHTYVCDVLNVMFYTYSLARYDVVLTTYNLLGTEWNATGEAQVDKWPHRCISLLLDTLIMLL